jgi:hypothetical protein
MKPLLARTSQWVPLNRFHRILRPGRPRRLTLWQSQDTSRRAAVIHHLARMTRSRSLPAGPRARRLPRCQYQRHCHPPLCQLTAES